MHSLFLPLVFAVLLDFVLQSPIANDRSSFHRYFPIFNTSLSGESHLLDQFPVQSHFDQFPPPLHQPNQRPPILPVIFTVMTFNTWQAGFDVIEGLPKVIKHIANVNPHIVALQETWANIADEICYRLNGLSLDPSSPHPDGLAWRRCQYADFDQTHVITRLPIVMSYRPAAGTRNSGCKLQISQSPLVYVDVWNVHLQAQDYGPYGACNGAVRDEPTARQTIAQKENKAYGRLYELMNLFRHDAFSAHLASMATPLILAGDFNAPSHLDWIDSTRPHHCNVSFQWPVSALLAQYGFQDSFRFVNFDPATVPGNTWSPIFKQHIYGEDDYAKGRWEPQDRIDFIYYRGYSLRPISSRVYEGFVPNEIWPNYKMNDWPSDHSAVITDFALLN